MEETPHKKRPVHDNNVIKKGIVIASIILCYCVIAVIYSLFLYGKIEWSLLFLALCMIYLIEVANTNKKLIKKNFNKQI
ncbi:hypothetical protein B1B04_23290 [Lysinibacillus sp. KCTC 33748]|uniref:hypothetical protein n=1 Tax=unclassified Lysinibacillus TaxID=2636778 RepID=UPI0009A623E5|nr:MULTISPECIES: hypothetical protein [unclassified Lysinibacillus]OXS67001.1 hypothetical protein B1B04_23290 [Lysinibacillus sp. KCTC 33748]SKC16196.1 hypothetical protein SAMN06295926_13124 [Lysinibacillus sp. AC-3]